MNLKRLKLKEIKDNAKNTWICVDFYTQTPAHPKLQK